MLVGVELNQRIRSRLFSRHIGLEARYLIDPEPAHNCVPTSGTGNANRYTTQSQVWPRSSLYRLGRVALC